MDEFPSMAVTPCIVSYLHFPLLDAARLRGEADAYLVDGATVALEGLGVLLALYLSQSLVGTLVYLHLKDIDKVPGLHQDVHATVSSMTLYINIQA